MPQITLDIPDEFVERFRACLPDGVTPLQGLKAVVKNFVVQSELNRAVEENKRVKTEEIRSFAEAESARLNTELDF